MPRKARVTKEMVLDAAFELVREKGFEALNVRSLAERIGCSTQPIMYNFASVDELRAEVYRKADDYHTCFILPCADGDTSPLLQLGLNYVRFAAEEPSLFRFLFQSDQFDGATLQDLMDDPALEPVLQLAAHEGGCAPEAARELFELLFVTAHGMASLLANNAMTYDEKACSALLVRAFSGVTCQEGE